MSSSPCAACKLLRRKCTQGCVFAPYFPPDQPQKFACVHKVFGASNVSKILSDLPPNNREDAVNSLYYEAEARLRDPVYGCVGLISILQRRLKELQFDLANAKTELSTYVGPQALLPIFLPEQPNLMHPLQPQPQPQTQTQTQRPVISHQHHQYMSPTEQVFMRDHHYLQQQQMLEDQRLAAVHAVASERQNEMFRAYGEGSNIPHHHQSQQQQRQVDGLRFNDGYDSEPAGSVTVTGFNQLRSGGSNVTGMSPSLALGGSFADSPSTNTNYHTDQQLHHQQHHETQLFIPTHSSQTLPLQTQETQTQRQPESEGKDGRRKVIGSSSQ